MTKQKCPHCGLTYDPEHFQNTKGKVPVHMLRYKGHGLCPGSGQSPRNAEADRRPLWTRAGS